MHNPTKDELDNDAEICKFVDDIEHDEMLMSDIDLDDDDDDDYDIDDYDDFDDDDDEDELDTFERFHDARRRGSWEDE